MKNSVLILASMLLFCSVTYARQIEKTAVTAPINNDSLKAQLIRDWQRSKEYTKQYLDAMPEDGTSFKPAADVRSFAEQMLHLSQATIFFMSTATGKAKIYDGKSLEKMDEFKTKAGLLKVVNECYDYAISALTEMDADRLSETVKTANAEMTRFALINKGLEHQTHHRGQTTLYLRLKGVKPPNEMLF